MKKNPFTRDDSGCSFVTILLIYIACHILYGIFFVNIVYVQDNKQLLMNYAEGRGWTFDKNETEKTYIHDLIKDANHDIFQEDGYILSNYMWVDTVFFYLFSLLFIISYLRLVLTDLSSQNFATSFDDY